MSKVFLYRDEYWPMYFYDTPIPGRTNLEIPQELLDEWEETYKAFIECQEKFGKLYDEYYKRG